jgi:hypothetical protein
MRYNYPGVVVDGPLQGKIEPSTPSPTLILVAMKTNVHSTILVPAFIFNIYIYMYINAVG